MTAPRTVHLLRHGATAVTGRLLGRTDAPATDDGIATCRAAAQGLGLAHIVSSDLCRAAATFPEARIDPRWRELDFGDWDDADPATIDRDALTAFWNDPDAAPPPGGERWSALVTRVGAALADLDNRTLVVTHGGAIRAALASACGFDARQVWAFDVPYAAVVTLRLWPDAAQIVRLVA